MVETRKQSIHTRHCFQLRNKKCCEIMLSRWNKRLIYFTFFDLANVLSDENTATHFFTKAYLSKLFAS